MSDLSDNYRAHREAEIKADLRARAESAEKMAAKCSRRAKAAEAEVRTLRAEVEAAEAERECRADDLDEWRTELVEELDRKEAEVQRLRDEITALADECEESDGDLRDGWENGYEAAHQSIGKALRKIVAPDRKPEVLFECRHCAYTSDEAGDTHTHPELWPTRKDNADDQ